MRPRIGSIPECTHRPPCPGCPHYALPGITAAALERLRGFASETGARLEPTVDCDPLGHDAPGRVLYLACDLESFLEDARALLSGKRLQLQRLTPFALFPFTEHVEVLGIFDPTDQTLKRKLMTSPSRTT